MPADQTPDGFQAPPDTEAEHIAVINDGFVPPFQVDRGPIARSAWDAQHKAVSDRAQHMADMATITEQVADEGGPLGTPTAFAVLRDIADAEPLVLIPNANGRTNQWLCGMCRAVSTPIRTGELVQRGKPVPHLISCPWHRATQIVGVKTDG